MKLVENFLTRDKKGVSPIPCIVIEANVAGVPETAIDKQAKSP